MVWDPTRHQVQIVDETYIEASPALLAAVFRHSDNVTNVWPHVRATLHQDRGHLGAIWHVEGELAGEFEVWLEPFWDGTIVHHYVRADVVGRHVRQVEYAHVRRWKRFITALKDQLEPSRRAWDVHGGQSSRSLTDEHLKDS